MKKEKLAALTLEELQQKTKTTRLVIALVVGVLIVFCALLSYLAIVKDWSTFRSSLVMPFALLSIVFALASNLKAMTEELSQRESSS